MGSLGMQSKTFQIGLPCILAFLVTGLIWHQHLIIPNPITDLAGSWSYCHTSANYETDGCQWQHIVLPAELHASEKQAFSGHVVYRRTFPTPSFCREHECAFLAGEIGDASKIYLNSVDLGQFGALPPQPRYAKNFPVFTPIASTLWDSEADNIIELRVYSFKLPQTGPRLRPISIVETQSGRLFSYVKVARNVFLPLACAGAVVIICCLTNLFPIASIRRLGLMPNYVLFCLVSCLFLVSFSEIPRLYLPVVVAIPAHFLLRYSSDWVFFTLLCNFFGLRGTKTRAIHALYFIGAGIELALLLAGLSTYFGIIDIPTDAILRVTYRTVYAFGFLLLIGPLTGALASSRIVSSWRTTLTTAFLCLAGCQAFDYLVYAGFLQGDYISKFHHLLVAIIFSGLIIRRAATLQTVEMLQDKATVMKDAEISAGKLAVQVAHDLRSPIAALIMIKDDIGSLEEEKRLLIRSAVERITDICDSLRHIHSKHLENENQNENQILDISDAMSLIVAERRLAYRDQDIELKFEGVSCCYGAFTRGDGASLRRVFANLINNAVQACERKGIVEIVVKRTKTDIVVRIKDNGKGMSEEQLTMLGLKGVTMGKAQGRGVGVEHAVSIVSRARGRLVYASEIGRGTEASIALPRCEPPKWFAPEIQIPFDGVVAVLDDDDSIHGIWKARFERARQVLGHVRLVHFRQTSELESFVNGGGVASIFLLDHELLGDPRTGMQVALELGICKGSILVTSHAGELDLQRACAERHLQLLSKAMAPFVPISLVKKTVMEECDAILAV